MPSRRPWTVAVCVLAIFSNAAFAGTCESLTALTIPDIAIASAVSVPAARVLPAFCRVQAVAKPVADSEIHIEIWLPAAAAWNGKFLGTGNGGYSGAIGYSDMERGLRQGYAVAGSDTGHSGGDLKFGAGHPEKITDWAWRAVHVMTETAKLVVRSYYTRFASQAYFTGCSTGGQQCLRKRSVSLVITTV